ncbi:hypothetical protein IMG5_022750, partial [Ichthyophthirius multifiliis]
MDINMDDGLISVNYSERLVLLIRETRQLFELGYKKNIPKQIIDIVENGKLYYKEALTLKQVANFFNSMSNQILPSLKKMLVDKVIRFEEVIKNQSQSKKDLEITWDNTEKLEEYIKRVQEACNEIMNENRRLRKLHYNLVDITIILFDIDLLKQKNVWKEKLEQMKRIIDTGCQGKDPSICRFWRTNWDFQIYKALEYQYQKGLQLLDQNMYEINTDLVLKGKNIELKPSLEELKEKYYKEIKNFINWPVKTFQGVGGSIEIYNSLTKQNMQYLAVVYSKGEQLFEKLQKLVQSLRPWTAICYLDVQKLEEKLQTIEDWEYNIKNIRVKRKDLEKLQDHYKIDCFHVTISPFKNSADDLLQNIIDTLTNSLRNSVKLDCELIEEFVDKNLEKLKNKPKNIEEINNAKNSYFEIKGHKKSMFQKFQSIQTKNKLLRNLIGMVQNTQNIEQKWESFEAIIADFDKILAEQMNQLKIETGDILNDEIDKFYQKWTNLKPKQTEQLDKDSARELALKMKEWRNTWKQIEQKVKQLIADCEQFEMDYNQLNNFEQVKNEIQKEESQCAIFDEFNGELEAFEKQDWMIFKSKLYDFQDFQIKWTEILKNQINRDAVISYMIEQVELYKHIWTGLRLCIGDAFEKDHWRSLFQILQIQKSVTYETLKFGDLLSSDKQIISKTNDIKELCARAQGEVALREAIQELNNWCDTYEFELTEYKSNNKLTPLIKEWKDLLTKVSDNQSLLISMKESKFYQRFQDQIEGFEQKLGGVDEYLGKLQIIQRKWVYLEPIFGRGALPTEQARFKRLDDDFKNIMFGIQKDPKVVSLCLIAGISSTLETILEQLEKCQKALNDFLEEKRNKFPRFYFLGDDDLLEILGQSQNPTVIQMHLKKLFAGINKVDFNKDSSQILSIISSHKEIV